MLFAVLRSQETVIAAYASDSTLALSGGMSKHHAARAVGRLPMGVRPPAGSPRL